MPRTSDGVLGSESRLTRRQQWFDLQAGGKNTLQGSLLRCYKCLMTANSGPGVYQPLLLKGLTSGDFHSPCSPPPPLSCAFGAVYLGWFSTSSLSLGSRVWRVCVPDSGSGLLFAA